MAKDMFEGGEKKKRKGAKDVNRGTQDEIEIIISIIAENLGIRHAVLEKIRQTKYRLGLTDKVSPGQENAAKKAK